MNYRKSKNENMKKWQAKRKENAFHRKRNENRAHKHVQKVIR